MNSLHESCPVLPYAQAVLDDAHSLKRAMRRLRRALKSCASCPNGGAGDSGAGYSAGAGDGSPGDGSAGDGGAGDSGWQPADGRLTNGLPADGRQMDRPRPACPLLRAWSHMIDRAIAEIAVELNLAATLGLAAAPETAVTQGTAAPGTAALKTAGTPETAGASTVTPGTAGAPGTAALEMAGTPERDEP